MPNLTGALQVDGTHVSGPIADVERTLVRSFRRLVKELNTKVTADERLLGIAQTTSESLKVLTGGSSHKVGVS
jgi:hypothetical protein